MLLLVQWQNLIKIWRSIASLLSNIIPDYLPTYQHAICHASHSLGRSIFKFYKSVYDNLISTTWCFITLFEYYFKYWPVLSGFCPFIILNYVLLPLSHWNSLRIINHNLYDFYNENVYFITLLIFLALLFIFKLLAVFYDWDLREYK